MLILSCTSAVINQPTHPKQVLCWLRQHRTQRSYPDRVYVVNLFVL